MLAFIACAWVLIGAPAAQAQCPAPPTLSGEGLCGQVSLLWNAVPSATGYVVRRGVAPSFSLSGIAANLDGSTTAFIDDDGVPGTQYWYWITANVTPFPGCAGATAASNFHTEMWQGFPSPAPTLINTSSTSCQIVIEWSIAPGAAHYEVYRSFTGNIADSERVAVTDAFPRVLTDPEIPFGESATYWVRGVSDCGEGPFSGPLLVTRSYSFPSSPEAFDAEALCLGGVRVTWSPPTNTPVTSYNLQWSRSDLGNFTSVTLPGDQTTFDPPNLTPGVAYVFFLTASNPCGLSQSVTDAITAPTPQATGVPATAPTLSASTVASEGCAVELTWNRVDSASDYRVYRSTTPQYADAQQFALVPDPADGDSITWSDASVPIGQQRWYWVRPINPCAQGPLSNSVSDTRTLSAPKSPTGVDVATPCNGQVKLAWTLPDDHAANHVKIAWNSPDDPVGGTETVDVLAGLGSLIIDNLVPGSNYTFDVRTLNACGESEPIDAQAVVAAPLPPPLATGSAADVGEALSAGVPFSPNQSYQWLKEGQPISDDGRVSGTSTHKLRIEQARWADAGVYAVRITFTNGAACEPVTSTNAILAVRAGCDGDIDGSGTIDLIDLLNFLDLWLANLGQNCP